MDKIIQAHEAMGDKNVTLAATLSDGCVLVRAINRGGCHFSFVHDRNGAELYSCESQHEESMLKHYGFNVVRWAL